MRIKLAIHFVLGAPKSGLIEFSFLRNLNASRKIFIMTDGELSVDTPRVRGK
jgi:hypothetical protein